MAAYTVVKSRCKQWLPAKQMRRTQRGAKTRVAKLFEVVTRMLLHGSRNDARMFSFECPDDGSGFWLKVT